MGQCRGSFALYLTRARSMSPFANDTMEIANRGHSRMILKRRWELLMIRSHNLICICIYLNMYFCTLPVSGGPSEMEAEYLQLTNRSEFPHDVPMTEDYASIWRGMRTCAIVIYVITCILGVSGNGLVIWATGFKLKRTAYTVWLLSLAVADFTFALLLLLSITYIVLDLHWPFGWLLCKLNSGMQMLCMHVSILTLAAISVDRCISVVLPIWSRNHRGPRLVALLSLGVWMAAAIISAPAFIFRQMVYQGNRTRCFTDYLLEREQAAMNMMDYGDEDSFAVIERMVSLRHAREQAVTLTYFLLGFLLPFLVISASYAVIGLQLRWGRLVPSGGKSFRVMAAIILAFLLCWGPYNILFILALLHSRDELRPLALSVGIQLSSNLAYLNSCINPVLYIFMWQDFRDMLKRSLQRVDNQGESMQTHL
uniref:chemerin-like receptor 1 isoform X2 n=1 Tax=Pristiophorus japonicus TaxID=55135 RepID=UPI00398F3937